MPFNRVAYLSPARPPASTSGWASLQTSTWYMQLLRYAQHVKASNPFFCWNCISAACSAVSLMHIAKYAISHPRSTLVCSHPITQPNTLERLFGSPWLQPLKFLGIVLYCNVLNCFVPSLLCSIAALLWGLCKRADNCTPSLPCSCSHELHTWFAL